MDVLFINPSIKKETQHPLFTAMVFSCLPLGLGYIAAYLRQERNIHPVIIDEVVRPWADDDVEREFGSRQGPLLVGFSCLTGTYARAVELAAKIKGINQDVFIVFGGAHPSALPEESLATGVVDAVVRGEGEISILELYDAVRDHRDCAGIQGVSYVKNGSVVHNPPRGYTDLDILPEFPYDLFEQDMRLYSDFGTLLTSRGCPFDCIFCSNRIVTGKKYRAFKIS